MRRRTKAPYARGRIVVWTKDRAECEARRLADPRYAKIAIANPEHAPYGKAAQQALEKAGIWETVKPKLVYGENVQQTLQYAQTGNAEAAIVALSLAIVAQGGKYLLVDDSIHKPIDQAMVVCSRGGNAAGARLRRLRQRRGARDHAALRLRAPRRAGGRHAVVPGGCGAGWHVRADAMADTRYQNVLITGASSGIGRAMAAWWAARGSKVYAAARREKQLAALAPRPRATSSRASSTSRAKSKR